MGTDVEARPMQKEKGGQPAASSDPAWTAVVESRLTALADDRKVRPKNDRWPDYAEAETVKAKTNQSWEDWQKANPRDGNWKTHQAEALTDEGYHSDTAIKVDPPSNDSDDSADEEEALGGRRQAGKEQGRLLRQQLVEHVTRAEKVKGEVYGTKATEARWNRRLVMSSDHQVLEVGPKGEMVDITVALAMAGTTGFDAAEALAAVMFCCSECGLQAVGNSKFILMKVTEEHVYWCRQCYSNMCKDNIADGRAWRKRGAEPKDKELGLNQ